MTRQLQKPTIHSVEAVARSRLFTVEAVDLEFSNGARRVYERMRSSGREAVMIVPIIDDHLILIQEYAVGLESYELGFPKGLIDPGETPFEAANRELKEEAGFGAHQLETLGKLTMAPSYFSSQMNIVVAEGFTRSSWKGMSRSRYRSCAGRWITCWRCWPSLISAKREMSARCSWYASGW